MSTAGLEAITEKEEIVATQHARELLERPAVVEQTYIQYVRSYIPLGQQGQEGRSVVDFERRVIRDVKDKKVPRGYITADYGYGKTSTALYLWKRAREENILAVPPFRMVLLPDLITATYGWLKYELERTLPGSPLIQTTTELYDSIMEQSVAGVAEEYNMSSADAQRLIQDKPQVLELNEADYLRFFDGATEIAQKAGFAGLLILADEVQQYIDPEVKAGIRDPLSPLFNLISGFITRRGHLPMGIMFVIPPRELENLRGQRGDFNQRVQPGLDLRTIYDREFPQRLWYRLAEQFAFTDHAERIITPETLRALGQISINKELSDGPRTVINTFKQMTKQYIQANHPDNAPYTPLDLIEDFLAQRIKFDSSQKIRRVTNKVLDHHLVKGYPDRELAIKWAAAFPEEGLTRSRQQELGLTDAVDALLQSANRELVIGVGDVKNRGITLSEFRAEGKTDTLSLLVDEFWRYYEETVDQTRQRVMRAFFDLLKSKVFPDNQWKVIEERPEELLSRNQGIIFEGSFTRFSRQYPERQIQVRILWEDEPVKDMGIDGELVVHFRLLRHFDKPEAERSRLQQPLVYDEQKRLIDVSLNLMGLNEGSISPTLHSQVQDIIEPYKLTPLLMLTLHEFINEKRAGHQISDRDDQTIRYMFQPDLLDNVFRLLFNQEVGLPLQAGEERIIEEACHRLLKAMYPGYITLMRVGNWSSSLTKYRNALNRLELPQERQGEVNVEGTKAEIADLFPLTVSAFDTFMNNFDVFLQEEQVLTTSKRDIEAGKKGAVRFTLHPLESQIKTWLKQEGQTRQVKEHTIRVLPKPEIYRRASAEGYREKEIDEIITLMKDREFIEEDNQGYLKEQVSQTFSIDELVTEIQAWQQDLDILLTGYNLAQFHHWRQEANKAMDYVNKTLRTGKGKPEHHIQASRTVRKSRQQLADAIQDERKKLATEINRLQQTIPQPNPQYGKNLNNAVTGGVQYVEQVNDLRSRLQKQYHDLATQSNGYQQQVAMLAFHPQEDTLSLQRMVNIRQEYQALERQLPPLAEKCKAFDKDYNQFVTWKTLVDQGSNLSSDIQQLGDLVAVQRDNLQELSRRITGHLSAHKLGALPEAPMFETELQEIKSQVQTIKTQATNSFTELQERYRQALVQRLEIPPTKLWLPHQYNPTAPEDSYRQVEYGVQKALREFYNQLHKSLDNLQGPILAAKKNLAEQSIPAEERDKIVYLIQETLPEFDKQRNRLQSIDKDIDKREIIRDYPADEDGQFADLLDELSSSLAAIKGLSETKKVVENKIVDIELTAEGEQLFKALPQTAQELNILRAQVPHSDNQFWATLRELHEKRRIRISVEAIM